MESESKGRDDQQTPESDDRHPQEQAAAELSERAAESVSRRYDATKESVHEAHGHEDDEEEDSRD